MNTRLNLAFWIGAGTSNNYAYLVVDDQSKDAVIIDPANPPEYGLFVFLAGTTLIISYRVAPILKEQIDSGKINLTAIINTHQ